MKRSSTLAIAIFAVALAAAAAPGTARAGGLRYMLSGKCEPAEIAEQAAALRSQGPEGLRVALQQYDQLVEEAAEAHRAAEADFENKPRGAAMDESEKLVENMRRVVDQVAGQRDAVVSRLYSYDDLAEAQAAAAESGKPILSLRMLGKLTDEYSCANSRYFRTALYSNKSVSDYLRDHFVLHWQTVWPVPRITIDFGDGRKLERTVTGNSAHYVLDAEGRALDVLPGLYGPKAFGEWLKRTEQLASDVRQAKDGNERLATALRYHADRLETLQRELRADIEQTKPELLTSFTAIVAEQRQGNGEPPTAQAAGVPPGPRDELKLPSCRPPRTANLRSFAKSGAETSLVNEVLPANEVLDGQDDAFWAVIAEWHAGEAALDEASIALMRRERPNAVIAGRISVSKRLVEDPLAKLVRSFEQAIALDTVKNEYLLHRKIHEWYVRLEAPGDLHELNEKVYAELFLTPSSDPWLGLAPPDAYTALTEGGLTATP